MSIYANASRKFQRHAVATAISLTLAMAASPGLAAPAAAHWTLTDLGNPGEVSYANAINNSGQVTGRVSTKTGYHAFLYSNYTMTDLGSPGGESTGNAINEAGQVAGSFYLVNSGDTHAVLFSKGTALDLGTLYGGSSTGEGISSTGQVTGVSGQRGFLYSNGKMTSLYASVDYSAGYAMNAAGQVTGTGGDLGGTQAFIYTNGVVRNLGSIGGNFSAGLGINALGQVTGQTQVAATDGGWIHAFIYANGGLGDMGTLGGYHSAGHSINAAGLVTGVSDIATDSPTEHAFIYSNGTMADLNNVNGVAGSGWTLNEGNGINDVGQIAGNGRNPSGTPRGFIATLDTTVWEAAGNGQWDGPAGWSYGIGPNKNTDVYIDPARSLTVLGPEGSSTVRQLYIGGGVGGNNGIATLQLNGGTITVTGYSSRFTTISTRGVLSGDGTIIGRVSNLGIVDATNLTITGRLANAGLVTGNGRLTTDLTNTAAGSLRVDAGQTLRLNGTSHTNEGTFDINGGELQIASGSFTNLALGRILINGGRLQVQTGLNNAGQILVNSGGATVFGALTTGSGAKLILSGNSTSTFYDGVDIQSGGELRVSAGSVATFFGLVNQRTGSIFSGTGTKFYEGGLSVGASPGFGSDEGDVSFGAGSTYLAEIGGVSACTAACATDEALKNSSFDRFVVNGHLGLGGTLKLVSWNGFTAQLGQRFDLLDWGSQSGSFDSIDASGLQLAAGMALDTSQLYVDGSISVQAVPEPETYALFSCGLAVLGVSLRRRRSGASPQRT